MRASASGPAHYRTAVAAQRDVDATLHGVATIEPVAQAAVAFPVSGTVATVAVTPGTTVTGGQPLATLDTASLEANLHDQQATLDQAKLTLQHALAGQSVALPSSTTRSFAVTGAPVKVTLYGGLAAGAPADDLPGAQQAVLAAQHQVDAARTHADGAIASATNVCAGVDVTADPTTALAALNACQTALHDVATAQAAVSDAQTALATASSALDALLEQLANQVPPTTSTTVPPTTTPPTTTAPSPTPPMTDTPTTARPPTTTTTAPPAPTEPDTSSDSVRGGPARSGGSGGSSRSGSAPANKPPSSADLVAFQSAVDAAAADVTMAGQALAQATVVSPITGTVVAVNIAPGQSVTAGSTTQTIVVAGAGGFEATTLIGLDDVPTVKVGQNATVTADGATTAIDGSVVSISAVPAGTTSTNYRVEIALPPDATGLLNGAIGSVAIMTGTAAGVAVPTSAVTTTGAIHTVRVLEAGTVRTVAVQVGVVGDTWTQITSGVQAGEQVVLASVDEPLPSAATSASSTADRQTANLGARIQRAGGTP
jgi:HlyD family secretion protein